MTRLASDRLIGFHACGTVSAVLLGEAPAAVPGVVLLGISLLAGLAGAWWFGAHGKRVHP